ncbi:F-box domain containing protein [Trema orientale]|uniref:F-box domain containing protein n=1 Tax=Trema orientale TaxID=63057 RepID=A0A2P5EBF1_TREOI|nr:F-box domain containing protein [Trema orientale]
MATEVMTRDGKMLSPTKTIISSISLPENVDTQSLDLISKLPEDILCFILSRLSSMRDAVKTSILSRRWRYLWRTSLENLSFDEENGELNWIYGEIAFVKHINKILEQLDCCGTAIQSFQVRSDLELPKYKDEIDNWLQFAAYKKVQKLDVDLDCFSPEELRNLDPELYLFPYWLFTNDQYKGSTLTHLTLRSLKFSSRSSSSSCPSPKLKLLNIKKCDKLKMVDICDLENLTSFGIFGNRLTELLCNQRAPLPRYGKSSMRSIRLWMEKKQREISSESWQHCNLREVDIFNFHGNRREVELVWYLGIHTVALGKIRVHRKDRTYEGDGSWSDRNPEVDIRRGRIFNMLHQRIPAATKLILL